MTTSIRTLRPGEAVPLTALGATADRNLSIGLSAAQGELPDIVALLVSDSGKVRTDDDLVFYNNPNSSDSAVNHLGQHNGTDWILVRPPALDADVARVVLGCAGGLLDHNTTSDLTLALWDDAQHCLAVATFPADAALQAMILFEVYLRAGQWRCRLLAQGYNGGLAALVTEFGISVDETPSDPHAPRTEPQPLTPNAHGDRPDQHSIPRPPTPPTISTQPVSPMHVTTTPAESWPAGPAGAAAAGPTPAQLTEPQTPIRRGGLFTSRKRAQLEAQNAELHRILDQSGAMDNAAIAAERDRLANEVAAMAAEAQRRRADLASLESRLFQVRAELAIAAGESELAEVGIYHFRHRLDDAVSYKAQIDSLKERIKQTAQAGRAVTGDTNWTVNGSTAQGRKMVTEVSKLMLRAYNADADHAVRTMRAHKLDAALARLDTTRNTIARLGATMNIRVSDDFHQLRRYELELTADYLAKTEEEKERQRELRERQREEKKVEAEIQREQERLERDRARYADAIAQLDARGDATAAAELRGKLAGIDQSLAGLAEKRLNMRLGHVYVISNIGAFGERMVKIGMTRRQEPEDRIRELGDASVPFRFDKHALIFSEDAVSLETALHQRFAAQRVNRVNAHREFFYVTPAEVRDALAELGTQYLIHFNEETDAPEWRQSGGPERALLPTTA